MPAVFLSNLLFSLPADGCGMHRSGTQTSPWLPVIAIQSRRKGEEQHLLDSHSFCLGSISNAHLCLEVLGPNLKQPISCVLQPIPPGFRIAALKRQFSVCCCVGETEQPERQSVYMWVPDFISFGLCFWRLYVQCWRLFVFFPVKYSRSWWYLPKRIYLWFLFILQ